MKSFCMKPKVNSIHNFVPYIDHRLSNQEVLMVILWPRIFKILSKQANFCSDPLAKNICISELLLIIVIYILPFSPPMIVSLDKMLNYK